jgi:hypothetical protein
MLAPEQAEEASGSQGVVILISLYLLLLAFFIVLTALSQREVTRAEAAVGSVVKAFSPDIAQQTVTSTTDEPAGLFRARDAFERSVLAAFADTLPVARFAVDPDGGVLRVVLPTESLFRPGTAELFGSARSLLGGLAGALVRPEPDQRYRLEALLHAGPELPTGERLGAVLEVLRVGALAREMRAQGAPADLISTGLRPGDPGEAQFSFYRRPAEPTGEAAGVEG